MLRYHTELVVQNRIGLLFWLTHIDLQLNECNMMRRWFDAMKAVVGRQDTSDSVLESRWFQFYLNFVIYTQKLYILH